MSTSLPSLQYRVGEKRGWGVDGDEGRARKEGVVPSGDGRWERWDRCDVGRGVGEGGRVMAGQGQTKPCSLARDESGMEGREVGGGGVLGVVTVRPKSVPVCVTPVGIDINTQHLSV